jgi:mediator of RNA polymerase II transcription subunit 12
VAMPDALVSPRLWYDNDELVQQFFAAAPSISAMQANATEIVWSVPNAGEVDERVRNLLFLNEPPSSRSRLAIAVSIVHVCHVILLSFERHGDTKPTYLQRLNRLTASYSSAQWAALLDEVFATESGDDAEFVAGLHILLSWATSPAQYGAHRPFVVLRLLKEWLAATTISSTHSSSWTRQPLRHDVLQNALFDWLDIKPDPVRTPGGEHPSQQAIAVLFGKLVHAGLFSFPSYLQRLLARNEPLSATNVSVQCWVRRVHVI